MSKKICGQVAWCMLLFPVTYDVASVAVEPEMSNVIYSTNKQLCELFLLQKNSSLRTNQRQFFWFRGITWWF
jgi:hypothetical protein